MNEIIHTYLWYLIYVPVHHCWVKTIIFNSWQFYSETIKWVRFFFKYLLWCSNRKDRHISCFDCAHCNNSTINILKSVSFTWKVNNMIEQTRILNALSTWPTVWLNYVSYFSVLLKWFLPIKMNRVFFIISLTKNNLPVEALSVNYRWWS